MPENVPNNRPPPLFLEPRKDRWWAGFLALAGALFLHLAVIVVLPEEFAGSGGKDWEREEEPYEITLAPPEEPEPEERRYVEANPEVPENEPDRKEQYSFRDQQAADQSRPDPEEPDEPDVDGEEDSQKIVQGTVEQVEPMPPGVYSPEAPEGKGEGETGGAGEAAESETEVAERLPPPPRPPDFLEQKPEDETGEGSRPEPPGEAEEPRPEPDPEAPVDVFRRDRQTAEEARQKQAEEPGGGGSESARPQPRKRPRLSPELTQGPKRRSQGAANRRGTLAIDATFSEFGEYERQLYAAIQAGWFRELEFFQPMDTAARVHVRFTLHADGSIEDLQVVRSTAGEVATMITESAIAKRSPFRSWTEDMVETFGDKRTLNVLFHYR